MGNKEKGPVSINSREATTVGIAGLGQECSRPLRIVWQADSGRMSRHSGRHEPARGRGVMAAQDNIGQQLLVSSVAEGLAHAKIVERGAVGTESHNKGQRVGIRNVFRGIPLPGAFHVGRCERKELQNVQAISLIHG